MNDQFEMYVQALIDDECTRDEQLKAMTEEKKNKNPKECAKYIMQEAYKNAKKNGGVWCGIDDAPIINLIIHYYTEDNLNVEDLPSNVGVVTPKPTQPKPIAQPEPKAEPKETKPIQPKPKAQPKKAKAEKKAKIVELDLFASL